MDHRSPLCLPVRLTHNHEDQQDGGHPCSDVEHESDVVPQLIHIIHDGHEHGWKEEPDGTTQLQQIGGKSGQIWLHLKLLGINTAPIIKR